MRITLIVAASDNDIIGVGGELPWRLPRDLAWFRKQTMGHPIIMGRHTWETLPGALDGRTNIVLSRQPDLALAGAILAASVDDAVAAAGEADEIMIVGGGGVYRLFLDQAERVLMTRVHTTIKGDVTFPRLGENHWTKVESIYHDADDRNAFAMTFEVLERK